MNSIPQSHCLFADFALLPDGWHADVLLRIADDGRIAQVLPEQHKPADCDRHCSYLLAAISNVHSHAFQRAMAGRVEKLYPQTANNCKDDFWGWREWMYKMVGSMTPAQIEAITALAYMEMLEAGFAAVGEFHYLHWQPDGSAYDDPAELSTRIMAAAQQTGIGLCLLPVLYLQADVDGSPLQARQRRFGRSLDDYLLMHQGASQVLQQTLPGDAMIGVAPHSLRAVSPQHLRELLAAIDTRQLPVHIHVAEQTREVQAVTQHLGKRPIQWLLDNCDLASNWCLVHATHTQPQELQAAAASGCVAGLCPQTEANLGDGVFALANWLQHQGAYGIGSDSNVHISVNQELRLLEYSQRLQSQKRNGLGVVCQPDKAPLSIGQQHYLQAARGGGQALQRYTGEIATGAWADLLHLDPAGSGLEYLTVDELLDGWIFASDKGWVQDVWSAGRHCVSNGQHRQREQILQAGMRAI